MEPKVITTQLKIGGMTCISCQNRIERKLRKMAGVKAYDVSYGAGTAKISYDASVVSLRDISAAIERLDYKVLKGDEAETGNMRRVIGILAVIVLLYVLLAQFGVLNYLVPSQLADTNMGFGMLFLIGLLTSIHCIAMCGGINLSQSIPRDATPTAQTKSKSRFSAFRPTFLYNLGRVASYTAIGGVLGFASMSLGGSEAGLPTMAQGILKLIAGLIMVVMGINILGLFPWLRRFQPHMPKIFVGNADAENARSNSPLIVGLLNGLMPCGPLQSMQIVALASGNPLTGAFSMFLFSMGTVPLMLGLGSIVSALGMRFAQKVMNVGAVLIVVLGLAMLSQGGSLSGLLPPDTLLAAVLGLCAVGIAASIPFKKKSYKTVSALAALGLAVALTAAWNIWPAGGGGATATNANGKQVVNSTLVLGRYPDITVETGTPVEWTINAPEGTLSGCNYMLNIGEYDIFDYSLQYGDNLIEFTPTEAGRFQYSCWMGMVRGVITVT